MCCTFWNAIYLPQSHHLFSCGFLSASAAYMDTYLGLRNCLWTSKCTARSSRLPLLCFMFTYASMSMKIFENMIDWGIDNLECIPLPVEVQPVKACLIFLEVWPQVNFGGCGYHLFVKVWVNAKFRWDTYHFGMLSSFHFLCPTILICFGNLEVICLSLLQFPLVFGFHNTPIIDPINILRLGALVHYFKCKYSQLEVLCH